MVTWLSNHLLQSTIFAGMAGILTLFLRHNHARTRYWLWLAASLKFLIPFSLFVEIGHRLSWSAAPVIAQPRLNFVQPIVRALDGVSTPFIAPEVHFVSPALQAATPSIVPTLLLAAWICGFAAVLILWCVRWWRVAVLVRAARPLREGFALMSLRRLERIAGVARPIELRSSVSRMEPGVFGIFRQVLLLPESIAEHLEAEQLDAIFAHELCHVRRRDNLAAAVHMLVEAIFWFHPLVWWIGSRLIEERERACDEEVVRLGSAPELYAETILKICKVYLESPLACAAGISGADLRKRIESIMENPFLKNLSLGKKLVLGAMALLALVTPITIGLLSAPTGHAQPRVPVAISAPIDTVVQAVPAPAGNPAPLVNQSAASSPQFEVADVHVSPAATNPNVRGGLYAGGRYEVHDATMVDLLMAAYDMPRHKVVGGPAWLGTDRFDVIAKAPADATPEAQRDMLRNLLTDRFKLKAHNDTRPTPAFALTVKKGAPQMKPFAGTGEPGCKQQETEPDAETVTYSCHNVTMAAFADALPGIGGFYFWDTGVVDQTKLKGSWDFDFRFTPQTALARAGTEAVKIFDAVDKQLGVKLDLTKLPLAVLVVDSVNEKPTENAPGVTKKVPAAPTAFEVADIKPSNPNSNQPGQSFRPGGRVNIRNSTLKQLIAGAWNVNADRVVGAPKFADTDRFDIVAKMPSDGNAVAESIDTDSMRVMLRALLVDRFKVAVHSEDQPVSTYVLTAAKPKLTKADPANRSDCQNVPATTPGLRTRNINCQNTTLAKFPEVLTRFAPGYFRGIPIVDATGIDGAWDISLNFSPANAVQAANVSEDPNGAISIFDAIEKQLGLKLELQKRPMPVLVIDHVEQKPTEN